MRNPGAKGEKVRKILPYLVILIVVFLVFGATLHYDFLATWDDSNYITDNPLVQGFAWKNIKTVFSRTFLGNYAPLHMISYMMDYSLWGLNPFGFRLTNLLLHLCNALFLFALIKRITKREDISLTAALLFAIHPLQVETVAWISQRKSLLAFALCLPSIYLYLSYVETERLGRYWGSVILYGLSLLSKVSTISLPLLLWLYDISYTGKLKKRNTLDKIPYFIVAGAVSVVAILTQTTNRPTFFYGDSLFFTLTVSVETLAEYVRLMLSPLRLSAYYDLLYAPWPSLRLILSILLLLVMLGGMALLFRKDKKKGFWAAWFFVVMLPNLNIIPLQVSMADRYLYIPIIGPSVLLGYMLLGGSKNLRISYGIIVVVIVLLCSLSFARTRVWKDDLSLWTDTVRKVAHGVPYSNLGSVYLFSDQKDKAKAAFRRAIELTPNLDMPYQNLGALALEEKDPERAIFSLKKAVTLSPGNGYAQQLLAKAYTAKGDLAAALMVLENALQYSPADPHLKEMQAQMLAQTGQPLDALPLYETLIHEYPGDFRSRVNYGVVLLQTGNLEQAEQAFNHAKQINGDRPGPYFYLGILSEKKESYKEAAKYYEKGVSKCGTELGLLNNLSFLYAEHFPEKVDRAIELAEKAVSIAPKNLNLIDTLGWAYLKKGDYNRAVELFQKTLDNRPEHPVFLYHAGVAYMKEGREEEGRECLTRFIQKYPDHRFSESAQALLQELQ